MDVAAFDFDGTLTTGGSVFGFLAALAGWSTVATASVALAPALAAAALAGGARADGAKEQLFQRVMAGTPTDQLEVVATRFGRDHTTARLRTEVVARLEWHRGRGDRVVIVSASPEVYVREAADFLGVDGVIATRLEVGEDGTLSGRYEGANCRGAEKVRRLRAWIEESGIQPDRLWSYGNSRGDLVMLRASDVAVNVGRLGRLGALRAYPGLRQTGPDARPV
jgi:phosphatidylglycerophosphatase C